MSRLSRRLEDPPATLDDVLSVSPMKDDEHIALTKKIRLYGVSFALLFWPAFVSWLLQSAGTDLIGEFLRVIFYYPRSLENLVLHWLKSEPVYKSVYIHCWYLNSYLMGGYSIYTFIRDPESFRRRLSFYPGFEVGSRKWWKWILLAVFSIIFFFAGYSSIMFNPSKPLGPKVSVLFSNDLAFYFLLPFFYPVIFSAGVVACFAFREGVMSFLNKGEQK